MSTKTTAIIGGGPWELSAGRYDCMNGYDSTIFETGNKPGGIRAAWSLEGYTIGAPGW